jgi:hypothetical protein
LNKDPFAEASKFLPHEDPDALWSAAFGACYKWMDKIAPFRRVEWTFIQHEMERIGRELTGHVDAEERARRKSKSRSLEEIMMDIARDAEIARYFAIHDAALIEEADATPDIVASGW